MRQYTTDLKRMQIQGPQIDRKQELTTDSVCSLSCRSLKHVCTHQTGNLGGVLGGRCLVTHTHGDSGDTTICLQHMTETKQTHT